MPKFDIGLPLPPVCVEKDGNRAVFEIRNCWPGYGMTLGNSLRRVLLSSLPGAAITNVKIIGASHEFSTIPYVLEDVVSIILNLKQLRFKMYKDTPEILSLNVKGDSIVTAADIKSNADVEVINKNAPIATLTNKNAKLEMEIQVEKGIGYMPVEAKKESKLDIGNIAIDAIFTPLKRVSFRVENMRVGKRTDFNKIVFSIETDGTISPEEALKEASAILVEQFKALSAQEESLASSEPAIKEIGRESEIVKTEAVAEPVISEAESEVKAGDDVLDTKVEDLKLPTRVQNALKTASIRTVAGLIKKSQEDLEKLEGLGGKGIKEIKKELGKWGLTLKQ